MKTNIFIPKTIKVGFQNRSDTYTQKLAYVIYYDQKNVLRKEKSWEGWRDKNIEPQEFSNEPTSGFVLNKKVGDYRSDWNHRHAYCRVYDSRGDFEFEITIENLLYILENATSTKGKGLEGEFIYGWSSKDILLIPCESPDYKEITQYNNMIHEKNYVKVKDLTLGGTYKTKTNEEYIYMGRFDYHDTKDERIYKLNSRYDYEWVTNKINKGKHHYFIRKYDNNDKYNSKWISLLTLKSLGERFISIVSSECVDNYAELFDKLECNEHYSPVDESKDEYIAYTFEEFNKKATNRGVYFYDIDKRYISVEKTYNNTGKYYLRDGRTWGFLNNNRTHVEYTFEEIFNQTQPMYKNTYLTNGKLYSEGK